ncbi:MAG TPA: trehalase family glycosidase, partial [Candidatus Saccharimonadales bacterium]|nr:trehalase family glycosidase [Candidatus Saccharimonadales bacterium]
MSAGSPERSIWTPKIKLPRWKIKTRRKKRLLSDETHRALGSLEGMGLLASEPVSNLLHYAADWDPFVVNKSPRVDAETPGLYPNPLTGEVYLPYPYVKPSRKEGAKDQWGNQQFYWDMYFINKALLASGSSENIQLAKNHIDNFEYMFDRLGYIPNATGMPILNRTQIPFLSGMVTDVYKAT